MQKITPCLLFHDQAEEAATFYTSVFKDSKIDKIAYFGEEGPGPKGSVLTVTFNLNGTELMTINGGPQIKFTPALSLVVDCEDQAEVDYYWEHLSEGGNTGVCGWLTDKFGVSWQIVPSILGELLSDADTKKADRVIHAMLQMTKLDVSQLQAAYDQK